MKKPRLLILAIDLPKSAIYIENSLSKHLDFDIENIKVKGNIALPYSIDSLLDKAVLGKTTYQDKFMQSVQKGCELYVGIKTPEKEYTGQKTKDNKFDTYQLGERGFDLAQQNGIPALLLDEYNQQSICDFVMRETK